MHFFKEIEELNSIKEFPVNRNYSDEEIARFFGYLITLDINGFLSIDLVDLSQDNTISININAKTRTGIEESTLVKYGCPLEKSVQTAEDIRNFITQLNDINTTNEEYTSSYISSYDTLKDVAALKDVVPNFDWDTYFKTFAKVYDLKIDDILKKTVKVKKLEKLKKIFDIIKSTDSKIVVNYMIWRFLKDISDITCKNVIEAFLAFVSVNVKDYTNNENKLKMFFLKELEILHQFKKSFSKIKSQLNNPNRVMREREHETYKELLSGHYLVEYFSKFKMNESTYYLNLVNMMHTINNDKITDGHFDHKKMIVDVALYKYAKMDNGTMPLIHQFVMETTNLWTNTFNSDDFYQNRTISNDCLRFKSTNSQNQNIGDINSYAAYYISLHDYLNYVEEHYDEFKKETKVLEEMDLNHAKAFMLVLAQQTCLYWSEKDLDDRDLLWFFKHSKYFSEIWNCTAGEPMNEVCDESTFVLDLKKYL